MFCDRLNMRTLSPLNYAVALPLLCSVLLLGKDAAVAAEKKITVLAVQVENDIGIENAGAIATGWLIDSIIHIAPDVRVVPGERAAELARLKSPPKADDISPSVARALRKSINSTHVLGASIFLWKQKYGITLRLIDLSGPGSTRIERAWAQSADDIPARIEDLTRLLFSPRTMTENSGGSEQLDAKPGGLSPEASALLKEHPEMVYVPGGKFIAGNDNDSDADNIPVDPSRREGVSRLVLLAAEKPEHTEYVRPFLIDRYEVTNAEYKKFRAGHNFAREQADHPVTGISWYDARAYASWAGKRLPTEQEWEKAARGADGRKWPWGNIFERGRCNLGAGTAPVGSFEGDKSPYGVHDMAGNVWELVADWYSKDYYSSSPAKNPKGPDTGKLKVIRGGSWNHRDHNQRCSNRYYCYPDTWGNTLGFRCAK